MRPDKPPLDLPYGKRVKWLREKRKEKQEELGDAVGVSGNRIAKLEALKGAPRDLWLTQAIGKHYGIEWQWLIEASPPRKVVRLLSKGS